MRELILVFNVECVLLGRNFDFLGGYLVVNAHYLVVTAGYCSLPGGYCSIPLVTARSHFYYERSSYTILYNLINCPVFLDINQTLHYKVAIE